MQSAAVNGVLTAQAGNLSESLDRQATEIRRRFPQGPSWHDLLHVLEDRSLVSHPCSVRFQDERLLPGEFAFTARNGLEPQEGFVIYVHPALKADPASAVPVVLSQIPGINTGTQATPADAEQFGCTALGISRDDYYRQLCAIAEQVDPGDDLV